MSNDTQPEIRFPGFTEDWEQRKLKYIFKYRQGQQVPVENQYFESGENRQKFIRIVDLTQKNEVPRYIEYFGENIIQKDDLFMIRYGQPGIVGYGYNGVIANNLFRLIPKISINNLFFYFILQGMFPMISKLSSSTTMPALSFNSLDLLEVKFPSSLIEQQKIGSFFKQLDDIITLHQRKLDLLKETKKGFLQKMFPKNGAKVPEIRFPGFTGDWEQRKLGDVLTVSKEKNKSNSYSKEQILSVSREVGTVNQIEYQGRSFAGADISGYKIVYPGQLIYTKSPLKGAPYGIFQLVTEEGIVSPLYAVYNSTEQALASFIGLQLKSDNIATHYLSPLVSKGAKNTINITDEGALDGRVTYPTITEQQKIVAFFKQLENTITLHQRKLDLLKETKKGFLQKMFV
ncbi:MULTISPECIES: restriction endonuclease subunit S [Enterococcus]|uniref:restriction endonuclease subunit S n=1 Tax=Enterococcus TaxID=1350 RepID=UPI00136BEDCD|nr:MULTISPECIES: restriction endonuclease subunit S [Enterococcus]MCH5417361.1 restriction endonuclease subunit S [Enterococcus lactis]NAB58605.1 restriction endonuclease subunit S [Enterococcus faecium]NRD12455.1 restriction endonuclease subunit S [Enterococcus faecium]